MFEYTICFIRKGEKILMLNRDFPEWMGVWNGVGGKIDANETPLECILREVREETGINLENIEYKGNVTWTDGSTYFGSMYVFIAELLESYQYNTPIKVDEGILDWKDISWILHPSNLGIADIQHYLPNMLNEAVNYEYKFTYKKNKLIEFTAIPLDVAFK
ncbi:DNA mismatch repair protein MutT [Aneurinibacillus migulanus]|uniref:NUDIX hydrolase n=1 Tax=Aneurinibacillus migulanus TaxID=47500 RepID=UPI0005BB65A5|nr:8-oxo-dGTP diphosphatase [Aneurinibacillus migulanus]KIV53249.1 DNA mismatch repair protein MutT [Aneurinibacillus migulanus]KPD04761.1 DNA mismatch repair protein MutT [Aneurinibacillus migulanus]MCP1358676.1 8-oxo-dGTP diphosphatase [Aneurinibacillus migulanus]CEH30791.1 NUDIX hydrolase [Aneurinibacillus migulanus]